MNRPRGDELDSINFLMAAQRTFSALEAARTHPAEEAAPAHNASTRLLQRAQSDGEALGREVQPLVQRNRGVLVIDDCTLDRPYAQKMGLVTRHGSGKHRPVVQGINWISLVWTDGDGRLPCDFRLYNKAEDGLSKNDHFRQMIDPAQRRGFAPERVILDSGYASLENLKLIRQHGWHWLTQRKGNRLVSTDRRGNRPIRDVFIPSCGVVVHLKGYGWIKVFKTVGTNGDVEYWATSRLEMTLEQCAFYALDAWQVEVYHRGRKQFTGIERARFRLAVAQRNHIGLAIRALVRLEVYRFRTGVSWFETKASIIREATRAYLAHPFVTLEATA